MRSVGLPSVLAVLLLAGCNMISGSHTRTGPHYPPRGEGCAVAVHLDGQALLRDYVVVGLVEAEGSGGGVGALIPELRRQACALGANAIIALQSAVSGRGGASGYVQGGQGMITGTSYSVYHATATAVVVGGGLIGGVSGGGR